MGMPKIGRPPKPPPARPTWRGTVVLHADQVERLRKIEADTGVPWQRTLRVKLDEALAANHRVL